MIVVLGQRPGVDTLAFGFRQESKQRLAASAGVEALRKIRQYYNDGIITADVLNVDQATIESQFGAGGFAGLWSMTDGLQSNRLAGLKKAVPTATLGQVVPFGGPLGSVSRSRPSRPTT